MSNLPNSTSDRIKVYPNEYLDSIVHNRTTTRLLQNDLYLETQITGNAVFVSPPSGVSDIGNSNEISIDTNGYLYVYAPTTSGNWGRITMDYGW